MSGGAYAIPGDRGAYVALRLTLAEVSALECALLDPGCEPLLLDAWWDRGALLRFAPGEAPALASEVTELANAEDALAEMRSAPERGFALRARDALTRLAGRIRMGAS